MFAELNDRETWDRWCERGILFCVLGMLLYTPLAFGGRPQPPGGYFFDFIILNPFVVPQVLAVFVAVLWALRLWFNPKPKLLWPPICWAVLLFTAYATWRYFTSDIEFVARQELLKIYVYTFLFFAVVNNLHRQESMQIITFSLIGLAVVISFYAIYQFLTNSDKVWHVLKPYQRRASGTFISPNHLGGFLELLLPIALSYTLVSRLKTVGKVFLGYAMLVMVTGIAVTVSRGSWFSTALALLIFFAILFFYDRYRMPSFVILFLMLMAMGYFFPKTYMFQARIKQLFAHGKLDDDLRFDLWQPAVQVWKENLWTGAGAGHYDFRFRKYRPELVQLQPDRAHNDFLNAVVDWGIIGAAIIASAWALLAFGVFKTLPFVRAAPSDIGESKSNKFALILGASLGLTAVLFHSLVDFNFHIPANAMLAITLMAFLASTVRFSTERYWVSMATWQKVLGSIVMIAGATLLGYQSWRQSCEKYWLALAARSPEFSPAKAAYLERAFAIEPMNFETASAIGEAYRIQSKEGGDDYGKLAAKAMWAFEQSMKLNRWDGYGFLRYGMCLDWLDRWQESGPYFDKAEELDPNGYFTIANIGLHYVQIRNYAAAKPWFERSRRLKWQDNPIAESYLLIVNRKMIETATNEVSARLSAPQKPPSGGAGSGNGKSGAD
jgi:O-antigen ligase